jgi:hypothetical protein
MRASSELMRVAILGIDKLAGRCFRLGTRSLRAMVWRQRSDHAFIKSRTWARRIARRWKTLNDKTGERLGSEIFGYTPALLAKIAEQDDNRLPIGGLLETKMCRSRPSR